MESKGLTSNFWRTQRVWIIQVKFSLPLSCIHLHISLFICILAGYPPRLVLAKCRYIFTLSRELANCKLHFSPPRDSWPTESRVESWNLICYEGPQMILKKETPTSEFDKHSLVYVIVFQICIFLHYAYLDIILASYLGYSIQST